MSYERDEAMRQQEATEAMIRMRERQSPHPDPMDVPRNRVIALLVDLERGDYLGITLPKATARADAAALRTVLGIPAGHRS